ncbi:MAG: DUF2382 domain-containing protein [Planctomycetota bacterium]
MTAAKKNARRAEAIVIPLAEERLRVTKETETRTVRIQKSVRTREARVDQDLNSDEVVVERVPVGRFVDAPVPDRYEGDTLVISVLEEVPVVRLRVKEEVRISRKQTRRRDQRTVHLRAEEATVQRDTKGETR